MAEELLMSARREETRLAYLGLGSNAEASRDKLGQALKLIAQLPGIKLVRTSPLFQTEPQEFREQPWFWNQCLKLEAASYWSAANLLQSFLEIEKLLGRQREGAIRYGPRAIDIDLLLFAGQESTDPFCSLPHPAICNRAFVLLPLYLLEPELELYNHKLSYWLGKLFWRLDGNRIYQD